MKYIERPSRFNNFKGAFHCEGCKITSSDYDAKEFYHEDIPSIKCKVCSESTNSLKVKAAQPSTYIDHP